MGENHGHNIFKMLKGKFKTPQDVNHVRLTDKEEEGARRVITNILHNYHTNLAGAYEILLRVLNEHPDYDPAARHTNVNEVLDMYYAENESPGEQILIQAKIFRELMWDANLAGCVVRFGLEISEVEKIFQRDAFGQLQSLREFLYTECDEMKKKMDQSKLLLMKSSNAETSQRKQDKAFKESTRLFHQVKDYVMNDLPKVKKAHLAAVIYMIRCYRLFHLSLRVRLAGMSTVQVPRSATA